ncbi:polysaccharide biosynthesis/export family protein [Mucilaginibacter auburnensis]|uniref:Polysaccharide export outer membrane protein n=1 Tax=Mucilaginibacter auburnensis TaxID=1457233 RepID=A0A2H9VTB3_9SPHI|nr:polysaccharide biosynthesis/export family protein [Mucilaginibacter auburnensis]PJJ84044.1 polysaccharide export outer membrane protein [Mucilaginibacter auburnensis]
MKHRNLVNHALLLLITTIFLGLCSCSSIKSVKYFADIPDSGKVIKTTQVPFIEPVIQTDDILTISIQSLDPKYTEILSKGALQSSAVANSSAVNSPGSMISGYLVDRSGNIEIPILGSVHVGGLTSEQARELLRSKAAAAGFKDVTVNLRYANFRITVYGEVNKPGTFSMSNEKVTIIDALGLAGDLTIYGRRDNVLLQRQNPDGTREFVRINLNKSDILHSPYYYLRQNDYIYVEPIRTKAVASDAILSRGISITTTVISFVISVLVVIIAKK